LSSGGSPCPVANLLPHQISSLPYLRGDVLGMLDHERDADSCRILAQAAQDFDVAALSHQGIEEA
jgi:hypothetical protein